MEKRYDIGTLPIDRVLKNHAENVHQKLVPHLFLFLVNNPKQPVQARNFKNKILRKRIIKKPLKS